MNRTESLPDGKALLQQGFRMLIGGRLVDAEDGARLECIDPSTGLPLGTVPDAGAADVDRAVSAARVAFPEWRRLSFAERRDLVLALGDILRARADELGLLDTLNTGNVYSAMRHDAIGGVQMIEYFAAAAQEIRGEVTQLDSNLHYTRREPYGVVARLLPFNHPIAGFASSLAAPLLTGNCVVMKPSPHAPMSALMLAALARDCLPPGVLNIVTGGNVRASEALITHPGVDRIALTGSVETGKAVMRLAAEKLTPVSLELGGKNPLVVFPDANVDQAVAIAIAGMNFLWQGHSCGSTSRVLVHKSLKKAFVSALAEKVAQVRVALPTDPRAEMGAISFKALYDRCRGYVESGLQEGATLVVGGERPADPSLQAGFFMTPAVFSDAAAQMRIAREEIFGPIITVLEWDDYDRMIGIANELELGLAAVLVTNDLHVAHRTAEALQAGYIEVNGPVGFALGSPFGGYKQSGLGREGSFDELLSYTQIKSVNIRLKSETAIAATISGAASSR